MSRLPILLLVAVPLLGACGYAPEQPDEVANRPLDLQETQPQEETRSGGPASEDLRIAEIPTPERNVAEPADVFGGWAANESECTAAAGPPVTISSSRYEGISGSCEINELVGNGDGFTASMSCERGGTTEVELLKLAPDGDTLALSWVARDEPDITLVRCE